MLTNLLEININRFYRIIVILLISSCATNHGTTTTIVGGEYDETKDETSYFVFPYGSASVPGEWIKTSYNHVSKQQFFRNNDSVYISIAFNPYNKFEFNLDGSKKGYDFVEAYYEWDSKYFVETFGLKRLKIESDTAKNYMMFKIFGKADSTNFNTYFLAGVEEGKVSHFTISATDLWSEEKKIDFLKVLYSKEE